MLNTKTRLITENYKDKWREAKKFCRGGGRGRLLNLKVLEGMEEAQERNET